MTNLPTMTNLPMVANLPTPHHFDQVVAVMEPKNTEDPVLGPEIAQTYQSHREVHRCGLRSRVRASDRPRLAREPRRR
jgi:hypothetical protein